MAEAQTSPAIDPVVGTTATESPIAPAPTAQAPVAPANGLPTGPADTEVEAYLDAAVQAIKSRDLGQLRQWASDLAGETGFWIDLGLIATSILIGILIYRLFQKGRLPAVQRLFQKIKTREALRPLRFAILATSWITVLIAELAEIHCPLLRAYSLILTCFVFINLPSKFLVWKSWMSVVSSIVFVIVALHILGLLDNTTTLLDNYSFDFGTVTISVLNILEGILAFFVLLWIAGVASSVISNKLSKVDDLSPNVRVLLTKTIRVGLFVLTFLITLGVMGIKVTTLTVFGGALGIGLGFGLQKVVSNLVSGIILLMDKSIKPGDVIEIGETYGCINSLNLRYASVVTRDNKEFLIPNEDLITNPVVNWSFSNKLVRIRAPFGISYASDVRLAIELAIASAVGTPRVVDSPVPQCNLTGFGDSSVDFELRFWIEDPHNGIGKVKSDVLLKVWDAFHENGIAFPFPQRDVHLRFADNTELSDILQTKPERNEPS